MTALLNPPRSKDPPVLPILLSLAFAVSVAAVVTFGWIGIADRVVDARQRIRGRAERLRKVVSANRTEETA
jgi:hypothetical protein